METSLGEEDIKNYFYKLRVKLDQYYDKDKNYKDVPIGFVVMFSDTFSEIYYSEWEPHMRSYFNKKRNIEELDSETLIDEFQIPYTEKIEKAFEDGKTNLLIEEARRVYYYAVRTQDIDKTQAKQTIIEFFKSRFPTQKKFLNEIKNTI